MECCILFIILGGLMVAMCVGECIFEYALKHRKRKVVRKTRRDILIDQDVRTGCFFAVCFFFSDVPFSLSFSYNINNNSTYFLTIFRFCSILFLSLENKLTNRKDF